MWIPTTLFVIYNVSNILEHIKSGLSIRTWWNNQRMGRITTMNSCFLGFLTIILKQLRISDTNFEITKKEQVHSNEGTNENVGRFIFNESLIFLPGTTILFIQLIALLMSGNGFGYGYGYGVGEVFCSAYVVLCYLPFLKGLFGKGKYGIPLSTIWKSIVLAFTFVYLCSSTIAK
jgi:hypothetical protein